MPTTQDGRRLLLTKAAETLAHEARSAAAGCRMGSSTWRFYHGVEAAAQHRLHPEMAEAREGTAWLDAEEPSFRDGFLEASALLASASAAPVPPVNIPLPRRDI